MRDLIGSLKIQETDFVVSTQHSNCQLLILGRFGEATKISILCNLNLALPQPNGGLTAAKRKAWPEVFLPFQLLLRQLQRSQDLTGWRSDTLKIKVYSLRILEISPKIIQSASLCSAGASECTEGHQAKTILGFCNISSNCWHCESVITCAAALLREFPAHFEGTASFLMNNFFAHKNSLFAHNRFFDSIFFNQDGKN